MKTVLPLFGVELQFSKVLWIFVCVTQARLSGRYHGLRCSSD